MKTHNLSPVRQLDETTAYMSADSNMLPLVMFDMETANLLVAIPEHFTVDLQRRILTFAVSALVAELDKLK